MFHGSYLKDDVSFLLKPVELEETDIAEKEKLIQSGKKHYSEMISPEYAPSPEYLDLFYQSFELNKDRMASDILALAKHFAAGDELVLVSLARAGTPVGVLLKRTIRDIFGKNLPHYSISIIRDRGIDSNALKYILKEHGNNGKNIVFIDGWTGKGVISRELKASISQFNSENNTEISSDLYVLADISGTSEYCVHHDDYLIPSSVLNSTISGLISRSILNNETTGENDFHACKYYQDLSESDLSLWFVENMMSLIEQIPLSDIQPLKNHSEEGKSLNEISKNFIKYAMQAYNVKNINYVKPGIGETSRVLLRRVPDRLLVKSYDFAELQHLILLAEEKRVTIEEVSEMPYKAVGIISNLER